jgi:ankyrin repeat protein
MLKASQIDPQFINAVDRSGRACLHVAVACGNAAATSTILGAPNVEVDAKDGEGRTALHLAVAKNDLESVKLLLEAGANAKEGDADGVTALSMSVENVGVNAVGILTAVLGACSVEDVVSVKGEGVAGSAGSSLLQMLETKDMSLGKALKEEEAGFGVRWVE